MLITFWPPTYSKKSQITQKRSVLRDLLPTDKTVNWHSHPSQISFIVIAQRCKCSITIYLLCLCSRWSTLASLKAWVSSKVDQPRESGRSCPSPSPLRLYRWWPVTRDSMLWWWQRTVVCSSWALLGEGRMGTPVSVSEGLWKHITHLHITPVHVFLKNLSLLFLF